MAERLKAPVLKTGDSQGSGGSNPSRRANKNAPLPSVVWGGENVSVFVNLRGGADIVYLLSLTPKQKEISVLAANLYLRLRSGAWDDLYDLCAPCDDADWTRGSRDVFRSKILPARNLTILNSFGGLSVDTLITPVIDTSAYSDIKLVDSIAQKLDTDPTEFLLSEDEARMFSRMMELYARLRMGQWRELVDLCVSLTEDRYANIRDTVRPLLVEARQVVYPVLFASDAANYGVSRFDDADYAWELHEVIRYCLALTKHPEGGVTVDFSPPMSFRGHELATCIAT